MKKIIGISFNFSKIIDIFISIIDIFSENVLITLSEFINHEMIDNRMLH